MGFCPGQIDSLTSPPDCAVFTLHDGAHALLLAFALLRMCYVSCWSPGVRNLATTGKLMQLIKIVVAVLLTLLPWAGAMSHVWHGFNNETKTSLTTLIGTTAGVDVMIRSGVWAVCMCMLILSQRHRVKESIGSVIVWVILLIGSLPWFLKAVHKTPPEDDTLRSCAVAVVTFVGYLLLVICGFVEIIYDTKPAVSDDSYEPLLRDGQSASDSVGANRSASKTAWKESRRGTQLWEDTEYKNDTQFTDLRYTAVSTFEPKQFNFCGYRLRCFSLSYKVKLMICITLDDQEPEELKRTLRGINENVKHLSEVEGAEMWQKVVVCILVDGKNEASENTLSYAASLGLYDTDMMQETDAKGNPIALHLFEYSAQFLEQESFNQFYAPLQIIFAVKKQRTGSLDSHRWFFQALCEQVEPDYCVLTTAGVRHQERALYKLYFQLEMNKSLGAVCGEVKSTGTFGNNFVVSAQAFEYKMSYVLDKSFESLCGYLTDMPEAFVAYRFKAIRERDGEGPLNEYFRGLVTLLGVESCDRPHMVHYHSPSMVLCFETVARANCSWVIQYVKNAKAVVQVPSEFATYVDRRAQMRNAKMFSLFYNLSRFGHLWQHTNHTLSRKLALASQQVYLLSQFILEWFYFALFYVAFTQLVMQMKPECVSAPGDSVHGCWKEVRFGVFNKTYGTERYNPPLPMALPQCSGAQRGDPKYDCYGFDSLLGGKNAGGDICKKFGICYTQDSTTFSLLPKVGENNSGYQDSSWDQESLVFFNDSKVLTLWGGSNDCYNPDQYDVTQDSQKTAFKNQKGRFESGAVPACCQPAIVEKCGKGTVFNASGAYPMDYPCYPVGCSGTDPANTVRVLFKSMYMFFIITAFVLGLGNDSADVLYEIKLLSVFFGATFYVMLITYFNYLLSYSVEPNFFNIPEEFVQWGTFVLIALVFSAGFLHGELQNFISAWAQYLFVWPSLINVCHIFSFARLDQIRPGHMAGVNHYTKGAGATQQKNWKELQARATEGGKRFDSERKVFRSLTMMLWLCSNVLCIALISAIPDTEEHPSADSVYALIWLVFAFAVITRFGGSIGYLVMLYMMRTTCFSCCSGTHKELAKLTILAEKMARKEKKKKEHTDEARRRRLTFERVEMYLDDVLADEQVQSKALQPAAKAAKDAVEDVRKLLESQDAQAPFDQNVEKSIALSNELQLLSVERRKYLKLAAKLPVRSIICHRIACPGPQQ
jgi:cellulose synthase/poly-beta-1,6-N-acetylglucosamine synthase-like glycosyltransferase